jgi:hypothetical protein
MIPNATSHATHRYPTRASLVKKEEKKDNFKKLDGEKKQVKQTPVVVTYTGLSPRTEGFLILTGLVIVVGCVAAFVGHYMGLGLGFLGIGSLGGKGGPKEGFYTCHTNHEGASAGKLVCHGAGGSTVYVRPSSGYSYHHQGFTQENTVLPQAEMLKQLGIPTIQPTRMCGFYKLPYRVRPADGEIKKTLHLSLPTHSTGEGCAVGAKPVIAVPRLRDYTPAERHGTKSKASFEYHTQHFVSSFLVCDLHEGNYGTADGSFVVQDVDCIPFLLDRTASSYYFHTHWMLGLHYSDDAPSEFCKTLTIENLKDSLTALTEARHRDPYSRYLPKETSEKVLRRFDVALQGLRNLVEHFTTHNEDHSLTLAEAKKPHALKREMRSGTIPEDVLRKDSLEPIHHEDWVG